MSSDPWKFNDIKVLKPDIRSYNDIHRDAIERVKEAQSGEDVLEVIFELNELTRKTNDILNLNFIRSTMDTTDKYYEEERCWVDEHMPLFVEAKVEFNEVVYNCPYRDYIAEMLGPMYFQAMELTKKSYSEKNTMLRAREAELSYDYQRIMAGCQVEIQGSVKNYVQLQGLFAHEDREVRKEAFRAFSEFLAKHEERFEEIWDELIKVRNEIGRNLGYENYLPVAYFDRMRTEYGPEEVANFRRQVAEEIVPFCTKLYEAQKKRLGVDKFMVYDEKAILPDGHARPKGDDEYLLKQMVEMFHDMSPETSEFVDFMMEHELIDYKWRPGKAAREYTTMIASKKAPFVFTFFDGTAADVQLLNKQLGHAFALYRAARKQPLEEFYSASADIMEIHSMCMGLFSHKYGESFFGLDADKSQFFDLQDYMTFIPFSAAVDEFQHICYANPDLTPKERTHEWHKLEEKYMPWRVYEDDDDFMNRGGYWYHKLHFFCYPLYYIEYGLATVNAMDLNRRFVERPVSTWRQFLALCDVGGSKGYKDTLDLAGLTPAYEDGAVKEAISYAKEVLNKFIEKNS